MEDRATGVFALQFFLVFEGSKGVWGVGDRQLGGVGVVGFPFGSGVDDVGESFAVFFGEPVGGAFRRGGLQVEQVSGLFLRGDDEVIDVVEQSGGEGFAPGVGDVVPFRCSRSRQLSKSDCPGWAATVAYRGRGRCVIVR